MKNFYRFPVWSNIFFLIPFVVDIVYGVFWHLPIITIVVVLSTSYHFYNRQKFVWADLSFAIILILSNIALLVLSKFQSPYFYTALFFALLSGVFYFRQFKYGYDMNHALFHICSAIITTVCILAFVFK